MVYRGRRPVTGPAASGRLQARWPELFGKGLEDEFGLDAMTILVRTNCMR